MAKRLFTLLGASVLAFTVSMLVQASLAQEKMEKPDKMAKQGRWEGNVIRSDPNKSTLTVRKVGSTDERTVHYDGATRWVSQEHGSKKNESVVVPEVEARDQADGGSEVNFQNPL